ncbi:MAG: MFS transporter [Clostridia bacterium]|nr:MFS transporter [Clostridia bacterium]
MKKITSRKKLALYGCSGMGVNMMNLIVGSYLCSALITGGFAPEDIGRWTYAEKSLVVAGLWAILSFIARVLDGVIDLPFASFTDRLKTRWGRRRPSLVIGFVPMIIAYLLFLIPLNPTESVLNTVWFGALLMIFYAFYTLTMLTFYATFSEVTETEGDVVFLSNVKSVCDVVYFILGYALLPVFVGMGINIRYVALIFLPLSLLMVIPMFLLKEEPTNGKAPATGTASEPAEKPLTLWRAIAVSLRNKTFIYWMCTAAVMNFGLQLFLGGINELFSTTGLNMTVVMASSFVPVPFTIILYNKIVSKKGLGFGYRYILTIFAIGMLIMYFCNVNSHNMTKLALTAVAILGGIFVSFSIGAFFSVTYTVPTHLAKREREEKGISVASMYFAVQGLFEGVSAGLATGIMLTALKSEDMIGNISFLPLIVCASCMAAFGMSLAFPKVISGMGKESPKTTEKA